ncbi:MAG: hypothetical protein WBL25_13810 [Anaerolineales bacterium]
MAALTFDIYVFPGQLKSGECVIEYPILPGIGIMTGRTFGSKTTSMKIVLLMAGKAIRRRSHKKSIGMTSFAGHDHMRPNQLET